MHLRVYFLAILFISFTSSAHAGRYGAKIEVQEALKVELNSMLDAASDLHKALFAQSEEDIAEQTEKLIERINSASKRSVLAQVQAPHLQKILEAAKEKLLMSQNVEGQQKKKNYAGAFKDLVQIPQVFDVGAYKVYFCNKDKSIWIQSSGSPQNPIHPNSFRSCGRLVR